MLIVKEQKFVQEDQAHNQLFMRVFLDETNTQRSANIHLKLKGEDRQRFIGNYHFDNKTMYLKRNSTKHYHYATKSYGFNYTLLNDPHLDIKWVVVKIDDMVYRFPKTMLDSYGTYLQFKQQGFELQRFLKFNMIKNYKNDQEVLEADFEPKKDKNEQRDTK
jgi:hypothetical protein